MAANTVSGARNSVAACCRHLSATFFPLFCSAGGGYCLESCVLFEQGRVHCVVRVFSIAYIGARVAAVCLKSRHHGVVSLGRNEVHDSGGPGDPDLPDRVRTGTAWSHAVL